MKISDAQYATVKIKNIEIEYINPNPAIRNL